MLTEWPKKTITWVERDKAFVSVPFTWNLPRAYSTCVWLKQEGYEVNAGGPAVSLMPEYLKDVAHIGKEINALPHHNTMATFTSRGCIRSCSFCAVPKIEGELRELKEWEPKPIVCDNNLLACSQRHFDSVIDRLKPIQGVDFNQGLDARLLTDHHVDRLKELSLALVRFSWDNIASESIVIDSIKRMIAAGFPKGRIRVYVLFGFNDSPDDALYRFETLKKLGLPKNNPQRYQPLDALTKNEYVAPNWTHRELQRFMRYWSEQRWLSKVPFNEFEEGRC
jgi:hypothetical protein